MTRRMWDSVTVADIPADAELVAGYLDGHYANLTAMHARFPKDRVVTVTPDGHEGANVDDREPGDQSAVQSAQFAASELKAKRHPAVYVSDANLKEVLTALALRDAKATLIFTAHWTGVPHICSTVCFRDYDLPYTPNVIGTQYADPGTSGGHYDLSLVQDYWPGVDRAPKPTPHGTEFAKDMGEAVELATRRFKLRKEHGSALDAKATKATHELIAAATSALGVKP